MPNTRREFFRNAGLATAGLAVGSAVLQAADDHQEHAGHGEHPMEMNHGEHSIAMSHDHRGGPAVAVETPDMPKLPWTMDGNVKVFRLRPEHVRRTFLPGWTFDTWGFNGSMPGPTIEVMEGDRVRFIVENGLPEPFSVHWHGLHVPIEMDGVPGLSQKPIAPGGSFTYEFTLQQNGTFFYHTHMAMQEMMGLIGLFIIHPRKPYTPKVDHDFGLIVQEWAILPNNTIPNSMAMEFNWLTINGKAGPATTPLIVRKGDRVRIRFVNLGMDHHPMHLHGNTWWVTGTEAGRIPKTAWIPGNTVLVGVAQARDVEFEAKYPGDWMLHCHLPHHMMNHMIPMVGPVMGGMAGMPAQAGMAGQGGMMGMGRSAGGMTMGQGPSGSSGGGGAMGGMPGGGSPAVGPHEHAHARGRDPWQVPGYPQDMAMDTDVGAQIAKPQTYGLPTDRGQWTGAVQGMSTIVRVLEPELYDKIKQLEREQGQGNRPAERERGHAPMHHHQHGMPGMPGMEM